MDCRQSRHHSISRPWGVFGEKFLAGRGSCDPGSQQRDPRHPHLWSIYIPKARAIRQVATDSFTSIYRFVQAKFSVSGLLQMGVHPKAHFHSGADSQRVGRRAMYCTTRGVELRFGLLPCGRD
jgi:hypothetical protein